MTRSSGVPRVNWTTQQLQHVRWSPQVRSLNFWLSLKTPIFFCLKLKQLNQLQTSYKPATNQLQTLQKPPVFASAKSPSPVACRWPRSGARARNVARPRPRGNRRSPNRGREGWDWGGGLHLGKYGKNGQLEPVGTSWNQLEPVGTRNWWVFRFLVISDVILQNFYGFLDVLCSKA